MANPSQKAPGINKFLSGITGRDREQTIKNDKCMTCGGEASDFKDDLSRKEYTISGMCQGCQDSVFG
ncbi:hypothetical protein LCGC14_2230280 [marine sediment metagenome]|uniref:Uncharacterized protein n=1 Tax=marine sediment metagenome TaxID=412755 RepID=A0A0F9G3N6_9ZZZZ